MLARVLTALVGIPIVLGACFSTSPLPFGILLALAMGGASGEALKLTASEETKRRPWISGLLWVIWIYSPLWALWELHKHSDKAIAWDIHTPLLLVFLPLWVGDTAAIFAGKAFGKHLLAPNISPKKTWEGAIANFLACTLASWGTAVWVGLEPGWGVLIGVITGILGQAGDLFESWLKRKAGVKDSGNLLPGHGGLLDRIDSLLFTAIPTTVVYMIATSR